MTRLSLSNQGVKYLLVWIDCLSRFAKVAALQDKTGGEVSAALRRFIGARPPKHIQSDKGTEFLNDRVQTLFRKKGIKFYTSEDPDTKAAFAERFIRTLKSKIYRYLTAKQTYRYIDVLGRLVQSYNARKHRSTGMAPMDVSESDVSRLLDKLYPASDRNVEFHFEPDQPVRLALEKTPFSRGYTPNWSTEIFYITERLPTDPPTYKLRDAQGERILVSYYKNELQGLPRGIPIQNQRIEFGSENIRDSSPEL